MYNCGVRETITEILVYMLTVLGGGLATPTFFPGPQSIPLRGIATICVAETARRRYGIQKQLDRDL
jgi:hypothetical protein